MADRLEDAHERLWKTIDATGKDAATLAIETAVGIRVMIMVTETSAARCLEEAIHYRPNSEGHRACMALVERFLGDARLLKKTLGGLTTAKEALEVMNRAHPKPS